MGNKSVLAANAEAAAMGKLMDGGRLEIHEGTMLGVSEPVVSKCLAVFEFGTPAFSQPKGGMISSRPLGSAKNCKEGKPCYWRIATSAGSTILQDAIGSGFNLDVNFIPEGSEIEVDGQFVYQVPLTY